MLSLSPSPLAWFLLILLVAVGAMALRALYYWWKRDRYTRERFAFSGFSALLAFGIFFVGSLAFDLSMVGALLFALLKPFGLTPQPIPPPLTLMEAVIIGTLFGGLIYAYIRVFTSWTGRKSLAQHEQEQSRETANVLRDIALLLSRKPENREKLAPHREDIESDPDRLEKPQSLVWHERARQLWLLRNRGYVFEGEYDPAHNCWLGEEKNTGALAVLACFHEAPQGLSGLVEYARKVADNQGRTGIELIVALKNDGPGQEETFADCNLEYTSEATLLADSVDFSNYFDDIRYRVERAKLVDSDLTLQDVYTPSLYRLGGRVGNHNLEGFIHDWLGDNTERQLALLGEYGQGKSTASLLLCYRLMTQADARIPILIELRGRNLRTMTPEDLLATWAYRYGIDPRALLHLHMAGRLLLIFEGFDEIDLSGDTQARISHFRPLWNLNYRGAKIIVTGRPNFFLDSKELRQALGTEEQTYTLYLEPFNLDQIEHSLRKADPTTRDEILDLARKDGKFHEVVARPSLLYAVSLLWQREHLSRRRHIDSALVIDLFIRQTLKRQQDKDKQDKNKQDKGEQDERAFMVLNSAERHYFMTGIAACMAARDLPNQIHHQQLEEAVGLLVDAIPDAVSQSVSAAGNEEHRPLRNPERLEWKTKGAEIMRKINNDVRSCGLLVTDPNKDGTFKFAHKSYMELLQAQTISRRFSTDPIEQLNGRSIANTWKLNIGDIQGSDEAIGFLAELLKEGLHEQGISEDPEVAKGLWDVLVIGKFSSRHTFAGFFMARWIWAAGGLAGRLVGWYGVERREMSALILSIGIFLVVAVVVAFAFAGAFAFAFAGAGAGAFAFAGAGAGAGAGAVAGAVAVIFFIVQALIKSSWPWQNVLLFAFSIVLVAVLLGMVGGLARDFLSGQRTTIFNRLRLWYRACRDSSLSSDAIEKTVNKGMAALLEDAKDGHP